MNPKSADVAIIGAGVSGLAAAWRLSQAGITSVIIEKSRGLSGRAATRGKFGHRYDHGANFFRLDDPQIARLLQRELSTDGLVEIPGDIHTFDATGKITPGDPDQNAIAKWTFRDGVSTLGKILLKASPLTEVIRETRITKIANPHGIWRAEDQNGKHHGPWKHLLITTPPPQAIELLGNSEVAPDCMELLAKILYHPQFTFVLGYARPQLRDRGFHALVNSDGAHPLAWISFEEDKPGHITDGSSVMIIQMSPTWTTRHYETPPEPLVPKVASIAANLLGKNLPQPDWWDSQRWRYALPARDTFPITDALYNPTTTGLHFAGDGLVGKGRITLAIKSGIEAANRIIGSS